MHANIHVNAISRSDGKNSVAASAYRSGRSVVAAAAYRAGEKLQDKQVEKTFDYTRKQHIEAQAVLAPEQAKDWARDRQSYWNAVEAYEKRKDALLAKEAVLVLPRNLNQEQRKQVVEGWANDNLVQKRGLVVDYAIHAPEASDGEKNYHAHVLYYPRPIAAGGEFAAKKLTGYKTENTVDGTKVLKSFRFSYQEHLNRASAANDNNKIIWDLRSYRERGIDRVPQPKKGRKVTALEKQGFKTEWSKEIEITKAVNKAKAGQERFTDIYATLGRGHQGQEQVAEKNRQHIAAQQHYALMAQEEEKQILNQIEYER